ncbi:MAG: hypothetical protein QM758_00460 [Armatimonas sp.]
MNKTSLERVVSMEMEVAHAFGETCDAANQYYAAVFAAGCALVAHQAKLRILEVSIQQKRHEYKGYCRVEQLGEPPARLDLLLAGEAAQVALGLSGFSAITIWEGRHQEAAVLIEYWYEYWGEHYPLRRLDDKERYIDQEIVHLIDLTRYQLRRRFSHKAERSALATLALRLRDKGSIAGREVTALIHDAFRQTREDLS